MKSWANVAQAFAVVTQREIRRVLCTDYRADRLGLQLVRRTNRGRRSRKKSMIVPARIAGKLPLLVSSSRSSIRAAGLPRIGILRNPNQRRRLVSGSAKMMALSSLESCNAEVIEVENSLGAVRPAAEDYAEEAVQALRDGKVIALPTDTLYGFACDACSSEAVNRIYDIKGRKHTSPLAICVGDVSDIERFAVTDHLPSGLLDSLLPGPVTVILSRGALSVLEKSLNPGLDSIGVRVPDSNFIRAVSRGLGRAIALTSANLSGQPSSVCINDFQNLWQECAFVYDGGVLPSGRTGSTIVDLTRAGKYRILRPGSAKEETVAIIEKHSLVEDEAVSQ
ncbi:unnamed protein product [Linum tenue]|uniref:Threonylcarbamoyl-AMP synthase n=2 Tax=Linum tenue TaxID=586396 RepID=A0AAV0N3T9_9ROSI|nr:unnamed protein product [Linum tenue]